MALISFDGMPAKTYPQQMPEGTIGNLTSGRALMAKMLPLGIQLFPLTQWYVKGAW